MLLQFKYLLRQYIALYCKLCGSYCILIYLIVAYDWWSFVGILLRIVWYRDLTIIWRWTCLQEFLVIVAQCVLLHFVCIDLVGMSGCHADVALFTGLGVHFFFLHAHACFARCHGHQWTVLLLACSFCWILLPWVYSLCLSYRHAQVIRSLTFRRQ